MKRNRIFALLMTAVLAVACSGCNKIYSDPGPAESLDLISDAGDSDNSQLENVETEDTPADEFLKENFPSNGAAELLNFRTPEAGEEIAVIHTSMGDIKVMLFPDVAPKAVENFKKLVEKGYYNSTDAAKMLFHRVKKDFVIQTGDPTGTGAGGESASGEPFEDEFSEQALHFRGALSMANSGADTNESQFFIVQAPASTITSESWNLFRLNAGVQKAFPQSVMDKYEEVGGTPWLDFSHTVFGQVFEGMDVVDAIASVPVSDDKFNKPLEDVWIQSITLESYVPSAESSQPESASESNS